MFGVKFLLTTIFILTNMNIKCDSEVTRHIFYRELDRNYSDDGQESRRVFGGNNAELKIFPAVAILLDRFWIARCSGSVIAPYWALTAAHCVTARLAYVKYNTIHPSSTDGNSAAILYLYRHPNYKVVQEDEGRGMDVTLLHHDLGLIRTRDKMKLDVPFNPISEMGRYNPLDLDTKDLTILGFGKTEEPTKSPGEELFAVKLRMVPCDRGSWFHCLCGAVAPGQTHRGVCAGDSGGPVVYQSVQIGVTSMGPADCAFTRTSVSYGATSVFTSTYHYVDLINATITDAEKEIQVSGVATDGENTMANNDTLSSASKPAGRGGSPSHQIEVSKKLDYPVVVERYSSSSSAALQRLNIPIVFFIFSMVL